MHTGITGTFLAVSLSDSYAIGFSRAAERRVLC